MNKQDESYKSFLDEIRRLTAEKLGGEYTVSLASTLKNNSVMLDSINISKDSEAIMPCIYLDDYFREYLKADRQRTSPVMLCLHILTIKTALI